LAEKPLPRGKLIALEGVRKADLAATGKKLLARLSTAKTAGGVSAWDASGIFFEMTREKMKHGGPSAKTLLMLYASDLAFRLRWEIEPALAEGLTVVAAPYVQTGLAFAAAIGVPADWTAALLRFAPKPDAVYRVDEPDEPSYWKGKPMAGFVEFGCATLAAGSDEWNQARLREGIIEYLKKVEPAKVSARKG
jgi:thymidylate kinase